MSCLINVKKNIDEMNVEFDITTNLSFGDTLFSICCQGTESILQGVQQCEDFHEEATAFNFIKIKEIKHEKSADREYSVDDVWNLSSSKSDSLNSVNTTKRFSDKKVVEFEHKQQAKGDDGSYSESYKTNSEESRRILHAGDNNPVLLKTFGSDIENKPPQKSLDKNLHDNTTRCHTLLIMPTRTNERKRKYVKDADNYISKKSRLAESTHVTAISSYVRQHAHHSGTRGIDIPQTSTTSCDVAQENRLVTSEQTQENASKTSEECGQEVQPEPFNEARNVKINAFGFDLESDGNMLSIVTTKESDLSEERNELEFINSHNSDLQADLELSSSSDSESDGENKNIQNKCRKKRKRKYEQDEAGQHGKKARCISINSKLPRQRPRPQPLFFEDNDIRIGNLFGSQVKKENSGAYEEYSNPYCNSQELGDSSSKEFLLAGARVDYAGDNIGCSRDTNLNENHESSSDTYSDSYFESDSSFDNDDDSFEEVPDPGLFPLKITPIKRKKRVLPSLRITLLTYRTLRSACVNGFSCCEEDCWLDWPTASLIRAMSDLK